jgi:hypothetical protein
LRFRFKQLASAILVLVVVTALATFAQSKAGQRQLREIGVAARPSGYTELAFVDPLRLPHTLRTAPTKLHVAFTITSREPATRTFVWQLTVRGATPSGVIRTGSVQLQPGARSYIDSTVSLRCSGRTRLTVTLATGEHIGLWASCVVVRQRGRPKPTASSAHHAKHKAGRR